MGTVHSSGEMVFGFSNIEGIKLGADGGDIWVMEEQVTWIWMV